MKNPKQWKFIIARIAVLGLVLMLFGVMLVLPVLASSWNYYFPITITDTSGVGRTNVPVLVGMTGANILASGYLTTTNATDTNVQLGSISEPFMMSTAEVPMIVPNLPAYSSVTQNFYMGYSPVQSNFPIITGHNGYITTGTAANLDIGNSGNFTLSGYFNSALTGNLAQKLGAMVLSGNGDGTVKFGVATNGGTNYPTINTTANNTGVGITNLAVSMPSGYTSGDLLLVALSAYNGTAQVGITTPTGWTELYQKVNTTYGTHGVWYKISNGSENASVSWTSNISSSYSCGALRIDKDTFLGVPIAGAATSGAGNLPDSPSLTSGFGAVDTLWLTECMSKDVESGYAAPVNYTATAYNGGANYYTYIYKRSLVAASEDPGAFAVNTNWIANTIAIQGCKSLTSGVISVGLHTIQAYLDGGNLGIKVDDGVAVTTAFAGSIIASGSSLIWNTSNIMPYCNSIEVYKSGVQTLWYQPMVMLTGTTVSDGSTDGTTNDGTITWGANSGITITIGAVVSSGSPTIPVSTSSVGGFIQPQATMPSEWFANGSGISTQQPWAAFSALAADAGMTGQTILMFIFIGIAAVLGIIINHATGSVLISVGCMTGVMYVGSQMTVIPLSMMFVFIVIAAGIMYLVRLI